MHFARYVGLVCTMLGVVACGDDGSASNSQSVNAAGSGGSATSAAADIDTLCNRYCANIAAVNCPNEPSPCKDTCLKRVTDAKCGAQVRALFDCRKIQNLEHFMCNDAGNVTNVLPWCVIEAGSLTACIARD
jgi:hypothetical protein